MSPGIHEPSLLIPDDPRSERRDVETNVLEHAREEPVLLEAVASPPRMHELALQRGKIERNGLAQQSAQVLERDRGRMEPMQGAEELEIGCRSAREPDPREIGVEVEAHGTR